MEKKISGFKSGCKKESVYQLCSNYLLSEDCHLSEQTVYILKHILTSIYWFPSNTSDRGLWKKKKALLRLPWFDGYFSTFMFWPTPWVGLQLLISFTVNGVIFYKFITHFRLCLKISYIRYPTTEIHYIHLFYPPYCISCIFYNVI